MMGDVEIGSVQLNASSQLIFSVLSRNGRQFSHIRKFLDTSNYKGPTKSGISMSGGILVSLIKTLQELQHEVPGIQEREWSRIPKTDDCDVVISIVPPDDTQSLPRVDVREYIDAYNYSGPTKKGVRFPWEKISEVVLLMQSQAQHLGAEELEKLTLFPEIQPDWVKESQKSKKQKLKPQDLIITSALPDGPKQFPDDFFEDIDTTTLAIDLPSEPVEVLQQSDGSYIVGSRFGFCKSVRNIVEGNYIFYAHLRGERKIRIPEKMIEIFKTVKAYENYLRELRHSLVLAYERKSGHRPMADHQTKEVFKQFGLPWIE